MRYLRSYRFLLILCFTTGILVFITRLSSVTQNSSLSSTTSILSNRIDERLYYLKKHFIHINISMLLNRPLLDKSPSLTYRCRELCGGCMYIKIRKKKFFNQDK